ncbi:tail completion protein gp17 [Arthrospiribacter ruber]|uniref:DUF3168 domain-containing protein n=1 Tax=Arthrospiribacter ruber TaxID=2487934 RepID=A0A951IYE4_9BACT|nr:hypothetical protein [Arthrospiribacter ruber]MBW3469078.1 hypothetical protein [Arthrospiribacter ruber]
MIEEHIYKILSEDVKISNIFSDNIQPLSGKKNTLPVLLYQVFQVDSEQDKGGKELKNEYVLRLHLFSEKYFDVAKAVLDLKELLHGKEIVEDNEIIVDLIRFDSFKDEYQEKAELFNRTMDFRLFKY